MKFTDEFSEESVLVGWVTKELFAAEVAAFL
jgi:hypothetical protein